MTNQTLLITGASGFIAKHIVLQALNAGYRVRGSLRSLSRGAEVAAAVRPHLTDPASLANLSFVALDLTSDDGWTDAMQGVDALIHTASPFPLAMPKDENALIRPAVDGALRALKAAHAAGVGRVVMTSSSVAIMGAELPPGRTAYDETDWLDPASPTASAYARSKTLAERAAWDYARDHAPQMQLTMINPVLVLGTPLDGDFGTSVQVIERILRAKDPMLPNFGLPVVDVADVATAHLRALTLPEAVGQRFILADDFLWFPEMAAILKAAYPTRRIVTRRAPNFVIRLLGLFDPAIRSIVPLLDVREKVNNSKARTLLGIDFVPAKTALLATARALIDSGKV